MCRARDNLKKKQAIRTKSEILMQSYRHVRNRVNKLNGTLKREYFTHKIASCEGDLKNTWKTINEVLNKKSKTTNISSINIEGKHISDSAGVAESMNNFFCTIGETLSEKIPRAKNPLLENDYEVNPQKTNRHQLLPPLREESNRYSLKTFMPRPPEKQFSWTDGATVPK